MVESALEEVLVDDGVELVGPQYDRHYKLMISQYNPYAYIKFL